MKMILSPTLRAAALAATLLLPSALASASNGAAADPATKMLAASGVVPISSAGPYVEIGTYRIHVWTKLGRPTATLPDGTWFYRDSSIEESSARGTLVVRFDHGRVSQLSLVSPTVATAMLRKPAAQPKGSMVASQ